MPTDLLDTALVVSRSSIVEFGIGGQLLLTSSVSRSAIPLSSDDLLVVARFAQAATPRSVLADLRGEYEVDESSFRSTMVRLTSTNVLIPNEAEDAPRYDGPPARAFVGLEDRG